MIDTVLPVPVIAEPRNISYSTTQMQLNYTFIEVNSDTCWYQYASANATLPSCANTSFTAIQDSVSTLILWINDSAGNLNSTDVTFIADEFRPHLVLYSPLNISYNTTTIWINYTLNESFPDTAWYQYAGANITLTQNATFEAVNNSLSLLTVWANDSSGNINSTIAWFTVDQFVNASVPVSPPNGTISTNTSPELRWYQIGEPIFRNYTIEVDDDYLFGSPDVYINTEIDNTATQISLPSDGVFHWRVLTYDQVGNMNTSVTYYYETDNTQPLVDLQAPPEDGFSVTDPASFQYIPSELNLKNCSLYGNWSGWHLNDTDDAPEPGVQNAFTVELEDGYYTWAVGCYDVVGNYNISYNRTARVDWTPPQISFAGETPQNVSYVNTDYLVINVSVYEIFQNTVTYGWNGTNYSYLPSNHSRNFTSLQDGQHWFYVWINDTRGYSNDTGTLNVTVDTIRPNVTLLWPGNGSYHFVHEVNFSYLVNDTNPIKNCSIIVDSSIAGQISCREQRQRVQVQHERVQPLPERQPPLLERFML